MRIFENTANSRPILKDNMKYIRSDVPTIISEKEKNWLIEHGITTVVDLRTDEERETKRCPLISDSRFFYHVFSVTNGDCVPKTPDDVSKSYIAMVDAAFDGMIEFLLSCETGVLYFCNAGKDRTGVVSAVLLHKLGMSSEYIINDYMESKRNLESRLNEYIRQNPSQNMDAITPNARYIEEFLEWYIGCEKK